MNDRPVGAVVCALGIVMLVATGRLPPAMLGDPAGPTLLPLILSWTLIGLGALLAVRGGGLRTQASAPHQDSAHLKSPAPSPAARTLASAKVVTVLAAYTVAFNALGYLVATALMLFFVLAIFNPGRRVQNATVAISFSLLSYLLFHELLGVFVPPGILG